MSLQLLITPPRFFRPNSFLLAGLVCALSTVAFSPAANAQMGRKPPIAITNAKIHTMSGKTLEKGTILIRGDEIVAVAERMRLPQGISTIDGSGLVIMPGLIDARSSFPLTSSAQSARGLRPSARGVDSIDAFASDARNELVRSGITTVYAGPGYHSGMGGQGVVVKLGSGDVSEMVLSDGAALEAGVGVTQTTPFGRLAEVQKIRKDLKAAKKYRESWDDYEEELEEYSKKLEERRKKNGTSGDEKGKSSEKAPPGDKDKKDDKPAPEEKKPPGQADSGLSFAEPRPGKPAAGNDGKKKDEKKEDDLKKPKKPRRDPNMEAVLEVLTGKKPLRVEAHLAEDILNVLDLAEEFPLKIILEGCSEGYRVGKEIRDANVAVVLGPTLLSALPQRNSHRFERAGNAARLEEHEVMIALGSSGSAPLEGRFLRASAGLAVSHGLSRESALRALTVVPATILGIEDRVGTLEKGKDADLVIFDGDPLDARSRVTKVMVNGMWVHGK